MRFTSAEKEILLLLAARAIAETVDSGFMTPDDLPELTDNLRKRCGVFVSLYVDQELRGCIGTFSEEKPLFLNVETMAVSAATEDSRFRPVRAEELGRLELEISVLTPKKQIHDPSEIIIGKHGIFLKRGMHRGTLLPQVAVKQNWTVHEFLGNCAKYKAGIGWDGWKTAEIYTYEAIVFKERMPLR